MAGAGTAQLSTLVPGAELDLLVGLGNGFDTAPAGARPLLVGGGVGASPLYGLAQQLVAEGCSPLAVRMVYQVYEAVHIPIVGMGGVTSAQDVLELMLAGATAVGVGAANLVEPYACKHIIETLPDAMARFGIDNLRDIIGGAHHG